ncbi:MAG: hypothetical protein HFE76_03145 [Firmicutes bacterium]|nr:hypothetical protein [Bacillota bacterium]
MVKLLKEFKTSDKEMRQAYCDALLESAKKDERIAIVNCDLCSSMGLKPFAAEFPDRSVNVGIEEANGCSMAGGTSAAGMLAKEGIEATVIDMFTIKPIDSECIIKYAKKTGAIVTAENHQIIGGLGSAVAEVLADYAPVPLERVGVKDEFGEVGPQDYLMKRFKLTAPNIVEAAKGAVLRKQQSATAML